MKKYALIAFAIILFGTNAVSQEIIDSLITYNYSIKNGLPSNQVLCEFQDSKGYIWFGTGGGGVAKYDGAHFEVFDMSNGMLDNEVFRIFEDNKGRVWFGTYSLQLSYYQDGEIYSYKFNEVLQQISKSVILNHIYVDEKDHLFLSFVNYPLVQITSEGEIISEKKKGISVEVSLFEDDIIQVSRFNSMGRTSKDESLDSYLNIVITDFSKTQNKDISVTIPYCFRKTNWIGRLCLIKEADTYTFMSKCNIAVYDAIDGNLKIIEYNDEIENIINVYLLNQELWVLTSSGIAVGSIVNDAFVVKRWFFKGHFTTSMLVDSNGGLWVSTHYDGVYHVPNPDNISIAKKGGWSVLKKNICVSSQGDVFYVVEPNKVVLDRGGEKSTIEINIGRSDYITKIMLNKTEDSLIVVGSNLLCAISLDSHEINKTDDVFSSGLIRYKENKYLITGGNDFRTWSIGRTPVSIQNELPYMVHSVETIDEQIFIGTNKGLYEVNLRGDSALVLSDQTDSKLTSIRSLIVDIERYKNGVWFAASGVGVGYYKDTLVNFIYGGDLSSSHINGLTQDGDTLWVSTDTGLNKIIVDKTFGIKELTIYNENNGLSSSDIAGVEVCKDYVYVSTRKGVDIIKKGQVVGRKESVSLWINGVSSLFVNPDNMSDENTFKYNHNDLMIQYGAIQFNAKGYHEYRYQLLPMQANWKFTQLQQVEFNNLAPDIYTFVVEVKNNQGKWVHTQQIDFEIRQPFWKTYWFIGVCVLLGAVGIYYYLRLMEKRLKRKNEIEIKIQDLKGKAMRAQVNPHFIFNTLNAIQNFVLEGDFEKSNRFISRFAKLIRMILRHSDDKLISLFDEVNMLTMYLEVEQMRFAEKFDFSVTVQKGIRPHQILLQSMLIQPYIENAIWHGMVDPLKKGRVEIQIKLSENRTLQCSVKDNGIGREEAEKRKGKESKKRRSIGMILPNERIKAFCNSEEDFVKVIDLMNDDSKPSGTEILITIPYKTMLSYESNNS